MRTWQSDIALYVRPPLPLFVAPILFYMLPILVLDITDLVRMRGLAQEALRKVASRKGTTYENLSM